MQDTVLTPSQFAAILNQTLELTLPVVTIEGELSNFRISKNRWVYFALQDEEASVAFFGTVYQLPGPLEDGLKVRVIGTPRLHPRFGFSINIQTIAPAGEGSIKKAADLLRQQLEKEGLFAPERKRLLPEIPESIGLITAASSAASADFIKILNERWGGVSVSLADVYVQGDKAPAQIVSAINYFNKSSQPPEVLIITRGGGSIEDLAAFNDERVVRAVAASRVPTLVAIGHEVDISLAELAADQRASTPSNAAQILVPDRRNELVHLEANSLNFKRLISAMHENQVTNLQTAREDAAELISNILAAETNKLSATRRLVALYDPLNALKRGYALVSKNAKPITSTRQVKTGDDLNLQLQDGKILAKVTDVIEGLQNA